MIGFDDAIALMTEHIELSGSENIPVDHASGRILAAPVIARSNSPRRPVATIDGYAVLNASTSPGTTMRVVGESRAGAAFAGIVREGEAVRIFTGAPMPAGTDRCIMQENAVRDGEEVRFSDGYGPAFHVRDAASDFAAGAVLLKRGIRLTPHAMVAAAAADRSTLEVAKTPRVAIIGTGDELYPAGKAHEHEDGIADSVTPAIAAMACRFGGRVVSRRTGRDDLAALEELARSAVEEADVVIVTGGASVGERDFAKPMFAAFELDLLFSKVAMKPGKPVWLGRAGGKHVIGLPGNPTSALVTARLFLAPLLTLLQGGLMKEAINWRTLPLADPAPQTGSRETFVRARWEESGLVPLNNQDSGSQAALARADWLIRCSPNQTSQPAGTMVTALQLSG